MVFILQKYQSESMNNSNHNGLRQIVIPSSLSLTRDIQAQIENALKEQEFPEEDLFGIRLALEEALVNAIKHGNQLDPDKQVTISYKVCEKEFFIRIQDEGPGFDPEDLPDPFAPENLERDCGRGLLLMRHYMSEVEYHPPGNSLTMRKLHSSAAANKT